MDWFFKYDRVIRSLDEAWWQIIHVTYSDHNMCLFFVDTVHGNDGEVKLKTKQHAS